MNRRHYLARHGAYVDYRIAALAGASPREKTEVSPYGEMLDYLMDHAALPKGVRGEALRALPELKDLL